jgi:hypothetical protein
MLSVNVARSIGRVYYINASFFLVLFLRGINASYESKCANCLYDIAYIYIAGACFCIFGLSTRCRDRYRYPCMHGSNPTRSILFGKHSVLRFILIHNVQEWRTTQVQEKNAPCMWKKKCAMHGHAPSREKETRSKIKKNAPYIAQLISVMSITLSFIEIDR